MSNEYNGFSPEGTQGNQPNDESAHYAWESGDNTPEEPHVQQPQATEESPYGYNPMATQQPQAPQQTQPIGQAAPYGFAQPMPAPAQYTQPDASYDGLSIAALVTGILGLGAIPLGLGIAGLVRVNKSGQKGKGFAITGIVLGALATLWWIIIALIMMLGLGAAISSYDEAATSYTDLSSMTITQLHDECADGSDAACDELFLQAEVDSAEEEFGYSCGGRGRTGLFCED